VYRASSLENAETRPNKVPPETASSSRSPQGFLLRGILYHTLQADLVLSKGYVPENVTQIELKIAISNSAFLGG
jgi:hypothetical protein